MAAVLMSRFVFYAQATILSSLTPTGKTISSRNNIIQDQSQEDMVELPLLGSQQFDPKERPTDEDSTTEQEADRITDLPGLHHDPGFRQYAGYLTVDDDTHQGRKLFYWYVESQRDPDTDPFVFWTNGGPGCSGLLGFGTEHGPFYISQKGDLTSNPYSWNTVANMLYVEQPVSVGFSYLNDPHHDYSTGDDRVASDAYEFILQFFIQFPQRRSNPFYVSSESYGGHYMPQCKSFDLDCSSIQRDFY